MILIYLSLSYCILHDLPLYKSLEVNCSPKLFIVLFLLEAR
jgi:hypothetical protein